jgi:hypothetical protein
MIITVLQAKRGVEAYGLKDGQLLFPFHESPCFYFVEAPNGTGKEIKISKKTKKCCHWGNTSTSPIFSFEEFEPVDDVNAWKTEDDLKVAAIRK